MTRHSKRQSMCHPGDRTGVSVLLCIAIGHDLSALQASVARQLSSNTGDAQAKVAPPVSVASMLLGHQQPPRSYTPFEDRHNSAAPLILSWVSRAWRPPDESPTEWGWRTRVAGPL